MLVSRCIATTQQDCPHRNEAKCPVVHWWAPCRPHEPCYLGCIWSMGCTASLLSTLLWNRPYLPYIPLNWHTVLLWFEVICGVYYTLWFISLHTSWCFTLLSVFICYVLIQSQIKRMKEKISIAADQCVHWMWTNEKNTLYIHQLYILELLLKLENKKHRLLIWNKMINQLQIPWSLMYVHRVSIFINLFSK